MCMVGNGSTTEAPTVVAGGSFTTPPPYTREKFRETELRILLNDSAEVTPTEEAAPPRFVDRRWEIR